MTILDALIILNNRSIFYETCIKRGVGNSDEKEIVEAICTVNSFINEFFETKLELMKM